MPLVRTCVLKCAGGTNFYQFPDAETDGARRKEWIRLLGIQPPKAKVVYACQEHFSKHMRSERKLDTDALPDVNVCDVVTYAKILGVDRKVEAQVTKEFLHLAGIESASKATEELLDIIEYDPEEEDICGKDVSCSNHTCCDTCDPPNSLNVLSDIDPDVAEILDSAGINPYTGCSETQPLKPQSQATVPKETKTVQSDDVTTSNVTNCATMKSAPLLLFAPKTPDSSKSREVLPPLDKTNPPSYSHLLCTDKMPTEYNEKQKLGVRVGRWVQTCDWLYDQSPCKMELRAQIYELRRQLREQEKAIIRVRLEENYLKKKIESYNRKTERQKMIAFCNQKLPKELKFRVRQAIDPPRPKRIRKSREELLKERYIKQARVRRAEKILKKLNINYPAMGKVLRKIPKEKTKKLEKTENLEQTEDFEQTENLEKIQEIEERYEKTQNIINLYTDINL